MARGPVDHPPLLVHHEARPRVAARAVGRADREEVAGRRRLQGDRHRHQVVGVAVGGHPGVVERHQHQLHAAPLVLPEQLRIPVVVADQQSAAHAVHVEGGEGAARAVVLEISIAAVGAGAEHLVVAVHDPPRRIDHVQRVVRPVGAGEAVVAADHHPQLQLGRQPRDRLHGAPHGVPVEPVAAVDFHSEVPGDACFREVHEPRPAPLRRTHQPPDRGPVRLHGGLDHELAGRDGESGHGADTTGTTAACPAALGTGPPARTLARDVPACRRAVDRLHAVRRRPGAGSAGARRCRRPGPAAGGVAAAGGPCAAGRVAQPQPLLRHRGAAGGRRRRRADGRRRRPGRAGDRLHPQPLHARAVPGRLRAARNTIACSTGSPLPPPRRSRTWRPPASRSRKGAGRGCSTTARGSPPTAPRSSGASPIASPGRSRWD